ncbi:3-methyladenine DNA glycosylase [Gordonia caeni]|uniref:DNA-3-methyladenine glycosylase family protein n=1 Tax=Gordonia caeni TaxID=1007097 RepID=UPI0031DE04EB
MPDLELVRRWRPPGALDVAVVLGVHQRGAHDPAYRRAPDGSVWRASHTPDGPGTVAVTADAGEVVGRAWGAGAAWLLDRLPAMLGADDDPASLPLDSPAVARLAARAGGLRIGRTDRVWEALVPAVMEQKVVSAEAYRGWRHLLRRYGEPAPGPCDLRVPPPRARWREITEADWHRSGLEPVRMRIIRNAAAVDVETKAGVLTALRGIGPWTAAHARSRALGDADAVPYGDYHVPSIVGQTLIGEPVDDAGMAELLAPYAGHRYRVIRMCELYGVRPPRRGPRRPVRDYREF